MAHQRTDRGANLVGKVGGKLHQASITVVQPVQHGIESVAQLLQLDRCVPAVEAFMQAAGVIAEPSAAVIRNTSATAM